MQFFLIIFIQYLIPPTAIGIFLQSFFHIVVDCMTQLVLGKDKIE